MHVPHKDIFIRYAANPNFRAPLLMRASWCEAELMYYLPGTSTHKLTPRGQDIIDTAKAIGYEPPLQVGDILTYSGGTRACVVQIDPLFVVWLHLGGGLSGSQPAAPAHAVTGHADSETLERCLVFFRKSGKAKPKPLPTMPCPTCKGRGREIISLSVGADPDVDSEWTATCSHCHGEKTIPNLRVEAKRVDFSTMSVDEVNRAYAADLRTLDFGSSEPDCTAVTEQQRRETRSHTINVGDVLIVCDLVGDVKFTFRGVESGRSDSSTPNVANAPKPAQSKASPRYSEATLDRARRSSQLCVTPQGNIKLTFGKHCLKFLHRVPDEYLEWAYERRTLWSDPAAMEVFIMERARRQSLADEVEVSHINVPATVSTSDMHAAVIKAGVEAEQSRALKHFLIDEHACARRPESVHYIDTPGPAPKAKRTNERSGAEVMAILRKGGDR